MIIYDLNDNPQTGGFLSVPVSGSQVVSVKIDCLTGLALHIDAVPDLTIEAKQVDQLSYTNIVSGSLDLGTWNGSRQIFQIRITAAAVAPYQSRSAFIG